MRTKVLGLSMFLVVGASAPSVWAANPPESVSLGNGIFLQGSDTLEDVTKYVIMNCGGAGYPGGAGFVAGAPWSMSYAGGGSGTGETAMTGTATQNVAPMSRFINPGSFSGTVSTSGTCGGNLPNTAQGLVIGIDGIAVVGSTSTGGACNADTKGLVHSGAAIGGVNVTRWQDALLLLYTGQDSSSAQNVATACNSAHRQALIASWSQMFQGGCASGTCTGPIRHAFRRGDTSGTTDAFLAALGSPVAGLASQIIADGKPSVNWFCNSAGLASVNPPPFQDSSCTSATGACIASTVKDTSCTGAGVPRADCAGPNQKTGFLNNGTTSTGKSFGGASDYMDTDPIRTTCETVFGADGVTLINGDQVCNPGVGSGAVGNPGTLGVVLTIEVPTVGTQASLYPTQLCTQGKFSLATPRSPGDATPLPDTLTPCPDGVAHCPCPNGGPLILNKCYQPYILNTDNTKNFNCIAYVAPVQGLAKHHMTDGRAYNMFVKSSTGVYQKDGLSVPEDMSNYENGVDTTLTNRFITNATFRLHTTVVSTGGGSTCQFLDSTDQIGCLSQADPCSFGYAGRTADAVAGVPSGSVSALLVNNFADSEANILANSYPLTRKLYFNSLVGFSAARQGSGSTNSGEFELAHCFADNTLMEAAMNQFHFIPMTHTHHTGATADGKILCREFDKSVCAGGASSPNGSCGAGAPSLDSGVSLGSGTYTSGSALPAYNGGTFIH